MRKTTLSERSCSTVCGESARCPRDEIAVPIALLDPVKTSDINTQTKVYQYWKRFVYRNQITLDGNFCIYTAGIPSEYTVTAGIPTGSRVKLQFWHRWHSNWSLSWYSNWIEGEDVKQRTIWTAHVKWNGLATVRIHQQYGLQFYNKTELPWPKNVFHCLQFQNLKLPIPPN